MAATGDDSANGRSRAPFVMLAILVVLAGASWWFTRDDRPRAESGQVIDAPRETVAGTRASVVIPWGRLGIEVSEPVKRLPDLRSSDADLRAPWRGRFVGVAVDVDVAKFIPLPRTKARLRGVELTLIADGRRHRITGLLDQGESKAGNLNVSDQARFVAVPREPQDVGLEIAFDGQVQTLDVRTGAVQKGRFAELETIPAKYTERSCGRPTVGEPFRVVQGNPRCTITWAARTPYVAGLGWAPPGRAWLAVTVKDRAAHRVERTSPAGPARYGLDRDNTWITFALGGKPPAAMVRLNDIPGFRMIDSDDPQQAFFQVAAGTQPVALTLTQQVSSSYADDDNPAGSPAKVLVQTRWQTRLP